MKTHPHDAIDTILDEAATDREAETLRQAVADLAKLGGDSQELVLLRRLIELQRVHLRERAQTRSLLRALVGALVDAGTIQRTDLVARIVAEASLVESTAALRPAAPATVPEQPDSPQTAYRGKSPTKPRPGFASCARCQKELSDSQMYISADGKFCSSCFDP
jgi:hypothetical protein